MFEKELPEWLAKGVKPPQDILNDGYTAGYKPPAEWENWFRNKVYEAMAEMRTQLENASPSGMIVMWSGTYAQIPDGWMLCDGNNGTPDLTDRFILGATSESEIGETGGEHEVTLTKNEMPSHSHSGSRTKSGGSHRHSAILDRASGSGGADNPARGFSEGSGDTFNTRFSGSHTHDLIMATEGGDQPHENRPAFYKLAFIMKA